MRTSRISLASTALLALVATACGGGSDAADDLRDGATASDVAVEATESEPDATETPEPLATATPEPLATATAASESETETGSGDTGSADAEAVAAAVAAYRDSDRACQGEAAELYDGMNDHAIIETDDGPIVAVVCDSFAYQSAYELLGWDGTDLVALDVEQWQEGGGLDHWPIVVGFPTEQDGQLVNLTKGRGPGDCGIYQGWYLQDGRLGLSFARVRDCDTEQEYVEPQEWDLVYPSGD